jgi:glycosyltransferase involved in cell wall biosynthesis
MLVKRLLLLAYFFPPDGGAGAQRPLKFAKYLPLDGWHVTVLTHGIDEARTRKNPFDESLHDEIGETLEVIRVEAPADGSRTKRLDPFESWCTAAGRAAAQRLDLLEYDAVLLTMSPFSLVRAAEEIRRQHPAVPIVLDFRDPWVLDGWAPQKTYWHWQRQFRVMTDAIHAADAVIANTPEAARVFQSTFVGLEGNRLTVIENGFDLEDFAGAERARERDPERPFTLVFSGSLCTDFVEWYSGVKGWAKAQLRYSPEKVDFSGRTLIHLLAAVKALRERGVPFASQLEIHCLGADTEADRRSVQASGVPDVVKFLGYRSHTESIHAICEADALFLPLHGLPPGARSRIVPGKTYEYLATGRPILGCLPDGDARELVAETGISVLASPTDPNDIAHALERLNRVCAELPRDHGPPAWIHRYGRRALAHRLAQFLDGVTLARRAPGTQWRAPRFN